MTEENKEPVQEKVKKERVEVKNQEPAATEDKKQSLIYVGPSIPGLARYSVHKNGIAESIKKKFESTPELEELFLDVLDFPQVSVDVQEAGTSLYAAYKVVEAKGGNI